MEPIQLTGSRQMNIRIKRLNADAMVPQYARPGDSGVDLVATEDVIIRPGETAKVPTGLSFEIPDGYEMQIRPRSGISAKTKLRISNSPGTIDAGFRGEVCVLVDNIAHTERKLENYVRRMRLISGWEIVLDDDEAPELKDTHLIRKGDRIAQGVIAPVVSATFDVVDELGETQRGGGSFGSTGTN